MSVSPFYQILNCVDIPMHDTSANEFYFDLVLADILKYSDPKYDKISLSNYFHSALNAFCSAEKEESFRKGIKIAIELLHQPTFNEFTAKAEYESLAGKVDLKAGVSA